MGASSDPTLTDSLIAAYLRTPQQVAMQTSVQFNDWANTHGYSFTGSARTQAFNNFIVNMQKVYAINTNARLNWW